MMGRLMVCGFAVLASFACGYSSAAGIPASSQAMHVAPTAATGLQVRAGIPMVYKHFGALGARNSWEAQRSSTVVLQNTGDFATDATVCFYLSVPEGWPVSSQTWSQCYVPRAPIEPGENFAMSLDDLGEIPAQFSGSALIYSAGRINAVGVQQFAENRFLAVSTASGVKPLEATSQVYVPTFYSDGDGRQRTNAMSALFAQNLDSADNQITVEFFAAGASSPAIPARTFTLAPGRSAVLNAPDYFSSFNGSAIVTAKKLDAKGTPGVVAAHVFELAKGADFAVLYDLAKAYVGFGRAATKLNMPTALCEAFGSIVSPSQSTAYAIQNVSPTPARAKVTFLQGNAEVAKQWLFIPANSKVSLQTCDVPGIGKGFSGSASIHADREIVAMGKAFVPGQANGTGTMTAFEGTEQGASELGIPYVRWSSDYDYFFSNAARTNIAVQNTGTNTASNVIVRYFSRSGGSGDVLLPDIAPGAKVNTNPHDLADSTVFNGILNDQSGSVEILGGSESNLSAIIRVQRRRAASAQTAAISEDYVAARREKEKEKQEYRCRCTLQVPVKVQDAVYYERGRTKTQEIAFCASAGEFSKPIAVDVDVEDCFACYDVCRARLAAKYYRNAPVRTIRPFGLPIGPNDDPDPAENEKDDQADLIFKDPCGTYNEPFSHTAVCPAP